MFFLIMIVFFTLERFLKVLILMEVIASLLLVRVLIRAEISSVYIFRILTFLVCESTLGLRILVRFSRRYRLFNSMV